MLFLFGSILAGVLLYEHLTHKESVTLVNIVSEHERGPTTSRYKTSAKERVVFLPACHLFMIKLGPVSDKRKGKYTPQILSDKDGSVILECETSDQLDDEKKMDVKFVPMRYDKKIRLKVKESDKIPTTAYYM